MDGLKFLRVAMVSGLNRPGEIKFNTDNIIEQIKKCNENKAGIAVMPRLYLSGATCADLFFNKNLLNETKKGLLKIAKSTENIDMPVLLGVPLASENMDNLIYDAIALINRGKVLKIIIPQRNNKTSDFFYKNFDNSEIRDYDFLLGREDIVGVSCGKHISLFLDKGDFEIKIYVDFADEEKLININNAYNEGYINIFMGAVPSKAGIKRRLLDRMTSLTATLNNACIFVNAPDTESTTDYVFNLELCASQDGEILANNFDDEENIIFADIDISSLKNIYGTSSSYDYFDVPDKTEIIIEKYLGIEDTDRTYNRNPYLPVETKRKEEYLSDILHLQYKGIKKRLEATGMKKVVIGISGGLDSTIALLSTVYAFSRMKLNLSNIITVQMPGFGSSKTTKNNSDLLCNALGITTKTIDITRAVSIHLEDIGHSEDDYNVTFENAQARYRTYLLMDIANDEGALVLGTGDLSEIALGFCTYNADHIAMYGLNNSLPKTVLQELIKYISEEYRSNNRNDIADVLIGILNTPISPELVPTNSEKEIVQKTEDLIGPYELHDFFLYYFVKCHYTVREIFELSAHTFTEYSKADIIKYMRIFYKRFFNSQFKRSCSYDSAGVLSFSLSPRGCFNMPSDMSDSLWQEELIKIEEQIG